MTLKQKAIVQTLLIICAIVVLSLGVNLILFYTPVEILKYIGGAALVAFLVYGLYGVVLSRLEYQETCKNISSKI